MKIKDLREKRAANIAEMRAIHDKATAESRELSGEERKRFDALDTETRQLNARLVDAEKLAEFDRLEARADGQGDEISRELRGYSVAKAITEAMGGGLTGIEAELHQELSQGRESRGVMIPTAILLESRALTTTTPVAGPGGNLVATQLGAMTDRRRAALMVEALGATVLHGLTGNLDLPRLTGSGSAGWITETNDATRSDAKFGKVSMAPKTVAAEYEVSRRMLLQSAVALEPILRADLGYLLAQKLDSAAIRGGGANEPTGILANTGVQLVPEGTTLGDTAADLIAALEVDDVTGTAAFLTNPTVMGKARKLKDAQGHFIGTAETFHAKRVEASTQVPANLGAGSKSALIYGEWASLFVGYWSGVDILVNPYHKDVASKGGALIHAFLDADVVVRHLEGFAYAEIA